MVCDQKHPPGALSPGKNTVPFIQESGWASGPAWTGMENLIPNNIWSPNSPAAEEIKSWLNSGNACHHSVWNICLSFATERYNLKTEICRAIICFVVLSYAYFRNVSPVTLPRWSSTKRHQMAEMILRVILSHGSADDIWRTQIFEVSTVTT